MLTRCKYRGGSGARAFTRGSLDMPRFGHPSKEAATDRLLALSEGTSTESGRLATRERSA